MQVDCVRLVTIKCARGSLSDSIASKQYNTALLTWQVLLGCTAASVGLTSRALWSRRRGNDVSM